jgi:hypothetical protein
MKKVSGISIVALILLFVVSSCSSLSVTTDYDKTADFSKYKTFSYYGWADNSDKILNQFDKDRIEKAFGSEFKSRGLSFVESGGDLTVTLFIVTEQKQQTTATTTGMGGGYGGYYGYGPGYGWGGGMSTTSYNTYEYTVGTLIIDVYDSNEKTLVFESIGKGTIDDNPKKRDKSTAMAVSAMMRPFPIAKIKE